MLAGPLARIQFEHPTRMFDKKIPSWHADGQAYGLVAAAIAREGWACVNFGAMSEAYTCV